MEFTTNNLRKLWLDFYKLKGHNEIVNHSLVPENDGSVLFTTAGMHPLVPYLMGKVHPQGKRLVNIQRCLRTNDIDEVGDDFHLTFFEMLGHWSLGDYFKETAIKNSFEFLTSPKCIGLPIDKIAVTVFEGDENAPRDNESAKYWKECGLKDEQIFFLGKKHNWWSAGDSGPCGPDTEMFVVMDKQKCSKSCSPACDCGRYVEIGNDVFMQYVVNKIGEKPQLLSQQNVDTGWGLERNLMVLNHYKNVYEIDNLKAIIKEIENHTDVKYGDSEKSKKSYRIICDHIRSSTFLLGDEMAVRPSNTLSGYVLRRLIRRSATYALSIDLKFEAFENIARKVIELYGDYYTILKKNEENIITELLGEIKKFNNTINAGIKELNKVSENLDSKIIDGKTAFRLYDTFGFPIELTKELAKEKGISVDYEGFLQCNEEHKEMSRQNNAGVFKGGLSSTSYEDTKYHTLAHLILSTLRKMYGESVFQRGCNITPERIRFDFSLDRKMSEEEKDLLQSTVNQKIDENIPVIREQMSIEDARKSGAMGIFDSKYGENVFVYTIGDFSKEICGGPHVKHTGELGKFQLIKEESSSSGVRRIKGILLPK